MNGSQTLVEFSDSVASIAFALAMRVLGDRAFQRRGIDASWDIAIACLWVVIMTAEADGGDRWG